jgi:hypothetical protein
MYAGNSPIEFKASELNENAVALTLRTNGKYFLSVIQLQGGGAIDLTTLGKGAAPQCLLTSEDPLYAPDPRKLGLNFPRIDFQRPGAVILFNND